MNDVASEAIELYAVATESADREALDRRTAAGHVESRGSSTRGVAAQFDQDHGVGAGRQRVRRRSWLGIAVDEYRDVDDRQSRLWRDDERSLAGDIEVNLIRRPDIQVRIGDRLSQRTGPRISRAGHDKSERPRCDGGICAADVIAR